MDISRASMSKHRERAGELIDHWYDQIDSTLTHPQQISLEDYIEQALRQVERETWKKAENAAKD